MLPESPPPPTRRAVLGGLLGAAGALALGGCGSLDPPRVREWNLFGGGDGARLLQIHQQYVAEHPDVQFEAHTLAWGPPFYTKLAMSAAGAGRPRWPPFTCPG